ncbi:hypothetical protein MXB_896 [Myxobolus squamalis]|nr:hypothetical protein MXB_896 [Myxobolus squamalis]
MDRRSSLSGNIQFQKILFSTLKSMYSKTIT